MTRAANGVSDKRFAFPNVFPVSRISKGRAIFHPQPSSLFLGNGKDVCMVGNHAVALAVEQAMRAAGCGHTGAFPITPATEILHDIRQKEAEGKSPSIGFNAHSEHEAMSAIIGSAFAQVRSFIATSSVGFLHMYEMVVWAAMNRVKTVMALSNREDAPLNIWNADSDRIRARDFTVQLVAENHQQAYDLTLQAFRIAEEAGWLTLINLAGFFISHSSDAFRVLEEEAAQRFVGPYKIDPEVDPFTQSVSKGGLTSPLAVPLQRAQNVAAWSKINGIYSAQLN